jgi:hypothetical protein
MNADQIELSVPTVTYRRPDPPLVIQHLRQYILVQEEDSEKVMERIDALLKNATGITYTKSYFTFGVNVENKRGIQSCEINIFRNTGEHKKPIITSLKTSEMIPDVDGNQQFAIEFYDTSRYFNELFRHVTDNYSAETIRPFSSADLNYGLFSFYSWENEGDAALDVQEEDEEDEMGYLRACEEEQKLRDDDEYFDYIFGRIYK